MADRQPGAAPACCERAAGRLVHRAVSRKSAFARGGGQVIDTTGDGGRSWYQTLFPNAGPVAVVPGGFGGQLLAFIGSFSGTVTWQYTSKDGRHTWCR